MRLKDAKNGRNYYKIPWEGAHMPAEGVHCEHAGTASSVKYVFDRLCPFLSIFACFGPFLGPIW